MDVTGRVTRAASRRVSSFLTFNSVGWASMDNPQQGEAHAATEQSVFDGDNGSHNTVHDDHDQAHGNCVNSGHEVGGAQGSQ